MPLLIGDIGGSSSRWALLLAGGPQVLPGPFTGFNASSGEAGALQQQLRALSLGADAEALEVMVYGAGCGHPARAARVQEALAAVWPRARIQVATDLLGAARSLYGTQAGLVLILGTGMNSGYYDGVRIHTPMPSLGFILGDEGSGADIGKQVLRDALYDQLPAAIAKELFPQGVDLAPVLEAVYRSPAAQAYVASFTAVLARHAEEAYVQALLASRFVALARLLERYYSLPERAELRAIGSVAMGFRAPLATAMAHHGMALTAVEQDPMPGLLAYHAQARS